MKELYYLGPEGTYAEIAAKELSCINNCNKMFPMSNISEVINKVDTFTNVLGVVPLENSFEGIVRDTIDNLVLTSSKVVISSEVLVKISHCLITKSTKTGDIKTIYSHPQGLAQCSAYIAKNFDKDVQLIPFSSTSGAVKYIIDKSDSCAAIASQSAASIYNIPILAKGINDQPENYTKFVLLDHDYPEPSGNDLTSIAISLKNKPGALYSLLKPFYENNINLCRIESRPSKKYYGDYMFFIDFDGHIQDEKVKTTIGNVISEIGFYRFLGSYPKYCKTIE